MKKLLLLLVVVFGSITANAQCTADAQYQDSLYGIWPDTIQNLPTVVQGQPYFTTLTVKTPTTLLEAAGGDSTMTVIDTVLFGAAYTFQIGDWPVDSMDLVQVNGIPTGLTLHCDELDPNVNNCMLPGNYLTCAYVDGTTNDPIGTYPIVLLVNVYTHGILDLGLIQYPLQTDLYSALGSYEEIRGYKLMIGGWSGFESSASNEFTLLQNIPNPTNGNTEIRFNIPTSEIIIFSITDIYGKLIYSEEIHATSGLNTFHFTGKLADGIYNYSIQNNEKILSKTMLISK